MRFFLLFLFLQAPLFSASHNPQEIAFDWSWVGNEDELYFKIDLNEGLCFDPLYTVHSDEKGQMCEISCKPSPEHVFETPEGYQLKNIQILVTVENTGCAREVFYKVKANSSYWLFDNEGKRLTFIVDYFYEDFLLNPTIDVTEDPLFYSFIEKEDSGVIRFLNLFHCLE